MVSWMNVEARIRSSLKAALGPTVGVGVDTPDVLEGIHFVRLSLAPGGFDDSLTDTAILDVEYFAPTKQAASEGAEQVRSIMLALGGTDTTTGRQLIDSVATRTRPYWVDYRNSKVHRYVATYAITSRLR